MPFSFFNLRTQAEEAVADLPSLRSEAEALAASVLQGAHAHKKSGGHEEFWQFRDYESSDRPQDIDWRMSARSDQVFVREKELHTPQIVSFWCNRSAGMDFKSPDALYSKQAAAQILSLSAACLMQRHDEHIGFLGESRAGRSSAAIDSLGHRLLDDNEAALPEAEAQKNAFLFLCGDFLEGLDAIQPCFVHYSARHRQGMVLQVLDPAEIDLPYSGHVVFEDSGQRSEKVDNVSPIRAAYQQRIQDHINGVRDLCAAQGWGYVLHRTDTPLRESMMKVWEYLQR